MWGHLDLDGGACLHMWVLLDELAIDIEHALAKGHKVIQGVSGMAINCDVPADACGESSFEVEADPVQFDNIFTNLRDNSLEFSMIFEDGTGALCYVLNREVELTSIIRASEACLECLDELIEGGELDGRHIFYHEPEFCSAGKEESCGFHVLLFVDRCSDVRMNLEGPGIDDSEGCVLSREG